MLKDELVEHQTLLKRKNDSTIYCLYFSKEKTQSIALE